MLSIVIEEMSRSAACPDAYEEPARAAFKYCCMVAWSMCAPWSRYQIRLARVRS
jgi:hypothetical protein